MKQKKISGIMNIIQGGYMTRYILGLFSAFLFITTSNIWSQNLLQNPGFEDWADDSTCLNWYNETAGFKVAKESGTVHTGSFSGKLILKAIDTQRFTQYVGSITSLNNYEFKFYCFDNDSFGRARVSLRWYDESGGFISGYYGEYSSDSPGWQELESGPRTAPPSAESAHVEIRLYDTNGFTPGSSVVYVDDASFVDLGPGTPPETLTIYEIQGQTTSSPYKDSVVVTHGIVTGVFDYNFFIEEQPGGAWHGIYVYGSSTIPSRGDSVRVAGVVTEYFGMTELTGPVIDILATNVSIPGPTVLPTGSVSVEEYESVFVTVDATCTDDSLGYGEWELDDGSGPIIIDDMGVSFIPDLGEIYTVSGPVYFYYDFKIEPRDPNDIIVGGGISETSISYSGLSLKVFPTFLTEKLCINLIVNYPTHTEVSVYSITGEKNATLLSKILKTGNHTISWNGKTSSGNNLPSGIYFIRVNTNSRIETEKVLILR